MTLTLDTSGTVPVQVTPASHQNVGWIDLDAFTQGYVEAALEAWRGNASAEELMLAYGSVSALTRFSDLAPDTLAAMMADCEEMLLTFFAGGVTFNGARPNADDGASLWRDRQHHNFETFPPVVLFLGGDGLIHHKEGV